MKVDPEYAKELEKLALERGGSIGPSMILSRDAVKHLHDVETQVVGHYVLEIPDYLPPSLNRLMKSVGAKIRLKKECVAMVAAYGHKIPRAASKTYLFMTLCRAGRGKPYDPDNAWKAILDALKQCRLIVDDSTEWVECCKLEQVKGPRKFTRIELSTVEPWR